ncbi:MULTISPECIES: protein-export chaperone SecB [unclassified Polynucleobacter]|uniref:protein-export chaperone SecB n=1 Tax=unclassified Polynucleobacter TaxID=2640945 RepID=UPI001BFE8E4A|nr:MULTISPECIES: protein-export chaperone SecB [unclassified Polynucleobacter]MBU3548531.1 protein-export chaperone SecB [Polynucleobacter sp. P1-05-14]MBU3638064.1 protein-export chaperone SecB [Polynucleobacter sp. AP-RePozz3-80-G7]MEA9600607.1 protein-export chaperone SecB [Polynucleobacter sp. MG-28-Ekke-A2]QWD81467.1 protein-export chaperone SecB [Polynucleobacter sp. MWH-S4W17]
MTEQTPAPQAGTDQAKEPGFRIQRIYLKDVSLEQPNAPQILLVASEPQVQVEIDISVAPLSEGIFEVALSSTVTAKVDTKVLFLVEAKQAGIFEFSNIPVEQIDPMLGIACPTILYPYLRSNIADIISRAGFQPIHLNEINFHGMYEHRLMQAQQEAAAKDGAAAESKPH